MTEHLGTRRGTVTREDDGRQRLEFRRSWPDPIEDVWSALTEPHRLARWIGRYEGERRAGGTGTFVMTQEEGEHAGDPTTILECDPPRRLVVEWVQQETENWRVALDLWSEDGRTWLSFVQVFPAEADVADMAMGWHWYLDKLDSVLGGRPAPAEWDAFVAEVGPGYGRSPS
ncbi:SRPBCC family protein [Blastococcus sp. CT_GayMR20]|uniref:SRPBCC family protein n=1 Tax=Blastococcus sp. CT_GayMR20 TaxID=2559609 RepID=UPI001072F585|nr:SRPBCC family protein [Blastococcus sp. CT_GayMR20]TFV80146.1 SRPBCC family protein [Blastococcus sp. CT_GayMR20]